MKRITYIRNLRQKIEMIAILKILLKKNRTFLQLKTKILFRNNIIQIKIKMTLVLKVKRKRVTYKKQIRRII